MRKGYARFATKEIQTDSIVDGEGIRSVIWFQGCSHNCPGCHNPETHDFKAGVEVSLKTMKKQIDVLVDGKFVMDLKSFDVQFRGSSNQRILDVKKSLEKKKAVKIAKYK